MNFGFVTTAPCINVVPPPDDRCSNPAFALANPDICPANLQLIIKPGNALLCVLGSVQFKAFILSNGVETEVTDETTFTTSNSAVLLIGAASGNATGMAQGTATVGASYGTYTANAEVTVMGAGNTCCDSINVGMMVLVDNSRSMSLQFGSNYATRLDFAKAAAARFINEVNNRKDTVGLISFNGSGPFLESALTSGNAVVAELANAIVQTQQNTEFYEALTLAIAQLDSAAPDLKVIVLISDGEDTSEGASSGYEDADNPVELLSNFKAAGGIVICLGCRASGTGFGFLSLLSTGGFFLNGYVGTEASSLTFLSGLKGYICAGNCTPAGDYMNPTPCLDYTGFLHWNVVGGTVDLLGPGLYDLVPGNGLYVDLAGSTPPGHGKLVSKVALSLTEGDSYRVAIDLAGNQRLNRTNYTCQLRVYYKTGDFETTILDRSITVNDWRQKFQTYAFTFNATASGDAYVSIQLIEWPTQEPLPALSAETWGLLLNRVLFTNATDNTVLLDDDFDDDNMQYVPPRCGQATYYYDGQYAQGTNCYGTGCLDEPPPEQLPDPDPLSNIEKGYPPPKTYSSTKQACASCPSGTGNIATETVVPAMTGYSAPSGLVTAGRGPLTGYDAWKAFDQDEDTYWISPVSDADIANLFLEYQFTAAQTIGAYGLTITSYGNGNFPTGFELRGSNDGIAWTAVDTRVGIQWNQLSAENQRQVFVIQTPTAYSRYRLAFTDVALPGIPGDADNFIAVVEVELFATTSAPTQVCRTSSATSTISQADADTKAYDAALALAQAELSCITLYTATESYTAQCEAGSYGTGVTRSATATSTVSQEDAENQARVKAQALAEAALDCTLSNNTERITINDATSQIGLGTPYPSVKYVDEYAPGAVVAAGVRLTINGFSHQWPSDVEIVLRSPDGVAVSVMRGCGSSIAVTGINLVLEDAASNSLPTAAALTSGTFKPTQNGVEVQLPLPAPQPPYGTTLAEFAGCPCNGAWSVWVVDRLQGHVGSIDSWDLAFI